MNRQLARLDKGPSSHSDRRREPRYAARIEANIETASGEIGTATLIDVSEHGCSIEAEADWLRNGRFLSIGLGKKPKLQAVVRWVRGGAAGMEFLRPIPPERTEWHESMDTSF